MPEASLFIGSQAVKTAAWWKDGAFSACTASGTACPMVFDQGQTYTIKVTVGNPRSSAVVATVTLYYVSLNPFTERPAVFQIGQPVSQTVPAGVIIPPSPTLLDFPITWNQVAVPSGTGWLVATLSWPGSPAPTWNPATDPASGECAVLVR